MLIANLLTPSPSVPSMLRSLRILSNIKTVTDFGSVQNYNVWDLHLVTTNIMNRGSKKFPCHNARQTGWNPCAAYRTLLFVPLRLEGGDMFHDLTLVLHFLSTRGFFRPVPRVFTPQTAGFFDPTRGLSRPKPRVFSPPNHGFSRPKPRVFSTQPTGFLPDPRVFDPPLGCFSSQPSGVSRPDPRVFLKEKLSLNRYRAILCCNQHISGVFSCPSVLMDYIPRTINFWFISLQLELAHTTVYFTTLTYHSETASEQNLREEISYTVL